MLKRFFGASEEKERMRELRERLMLTVDNFKVPATLPL